MLATGLSLSPAGQRDDDVVTGTFWYLAGRGLFRMDGVAMRIIASTRAVGFMSVPAVAIFGGGLIQLLPAS